MEASFAWPPGIEKYAERKLSLIRETMNTKRSAQKAKEPTWLFENIAETSKRASKVYFLYLSFLAYCVLTILTTSIWDVTRNKPILLPVIEVELSFKFFSILSPIAGIIFFMFLQMYLNWLKELKNEIKKEYGSIKKLRLYPWVINIVLDPGRKFLEKFQFLIVSFTIWWALLLVLMVFYFRFSTRSGPTISLFLGIISIIGFLIVFFYRYQCDLQDKKKFTFQQKIIILFAAIFISLFGWQYLSSIISDIAIKVWNSIDLSYQNLITEKNEQERYWLNLSGVHLEKAQLEGTVLTRANLADGHFERAWLKNAILKEANLTQANFHMADLSGADLTKADFTYANLSGANLYGADLSYASLMNVKNLTIEQLSQVKTLYDAQLDPDLNKKIKEKYPHLLEEPKLEEKKKEN